LSLTDQFPPTHTHTPHRPPPAAGVLLANGFNAALGFLKGGPQKMQEAAMQAMVQQMMKQAMGPGGPGAAGAWGGGRCGKGCVGE
jgi:hypothetical protein